MLFALALAGLLTVVLPVATIASAAPRNIVLIVGDDHGREAGCYGHPVVRTPHLDRLAAEGTRFDYAFCTTASCSPSRSVLLTGRQNHANGQYGLEHDVHHFQAFDGTVTLPALLAKAGYRTIRTGKLHVGPAAAYRFDEVVPGNPRNGVEMARQCRRTLESPDPRPFFLYFCPTDPHRSGDRGAASEKPDRFGNRAYAGVRAEVYDPKQAVVPPFLPDTPECRAELAEYYQSVSRLDAGIGELMSLLRSLGKYENTLIVYVSDNGVPFPGAKTTLYEPGMRLPCVVRHPEQTRRGVVSRAMVSWVDVAPAILQFAGVALPTGPRAAMHGRSFLHTLDKENPPGWDEVYASHTFHEATMYYPMRVVRGRRFKLIWNIASGLSYPFASDLWESATWQGTLRDHREFYGRRRVEAYLHRPPFELYDLEADPDEVRNLAGDPRHAATLAELKSKLADFQKRTADPWRIKWEHE